MLSLKQSVFAFVFGVILFIASLTNILTTKLEQDFIVLLALLYSIISMLLGFGKIYLWFLKKFTKDNKKKEELEKFEAGIEQKNNINGYSFVLKIKKIADKYGFLFILLGLVFFSFSATLLVILILVIYAKQNITFWQHIQQNISIYLFIMLSFYLIFSLIDTLLKLHKKQYQKEQESDKIITDYENLQDNLVGIINYLSTTTGYSHHSLKNASVIIDGMIKNIEVGDVIKEEDKRDLILGVDNLWRAIEDFNTFGKPKGEVNYPIETLINAIHLLHKVKTKKFEFAIIYQNIDKTTKLNVEWHDAYQMIDNLLINAYDAVATTEIKKVSLIISPSKDNFVSIIVADTGEGIPKYYQDKLFVLGFTTKTTPNIKRGTGLTHIKYLAEKNNGTVAYKTTNQEYSTIFELLLPISK